WVSSYYTSKSVCDQTAHLYLGYDLTPATLAPDETEFLEIAALPFTDVLDGEWHSAYLMLFALNLTFLAVPAGRFLGADQFILPRLAPALYHHLRGIDTFEPIVANVRAFVAMQENLHELLDFVRLAAQIGVPEVYLQRLVYFGDGQRLGDGT